MLFALNFVQDCDLYQFFEVPAYFFKNIIGAEEFNNDLFPDWFGDVIDRAPKLKEEFELLAKCIISKDEGSRKILYRIFVNHNRVARLCLNTELELQEFPDELNDVAVLSRKVFDRLYNTTLQSAAVGRSLGEDIYSHYTKFRDINLSQVCPFCGLENYSDRFKRSRSQYDHYLMKSKYFFGAVNFSNLVPMCSACNEAPNKHSKDILFSNTGVRRLVYYPFGSASGVTANVANLRPSSVDYGGDWEVTITANSAEEAAKVCEWLVVFNVKDRYAARIREESNNWLIEYLVQMVPPVDLNDLNSWRYSLRSWFDGLVLINRRRPVRNGIVKAAYFDYLYRAASDSEIWGIKSLAESAFISVRNGAIA